MRVLVSCCLVLLALFAISVSAFSEPSIPEQIKELEQKAAYLDGLFVQVMGELQDVAQAAKPVFEEAEPLLKLKKLTTAQKLKIALAAYYEQYIGRLATLIKLIILERTVTEAQINYLKQMKGA